MRIKKNMYEVLRERLQSLFVAKNRNLNNLILTGDCYKWKIFIVVEENEVLKLVKNLDVWKAIGLDGVVGWILRECQEELVELIHDIIKTS